jgi:hypothetical protein
VVQHVAAAGLFRATRDFALHMFDSPEHSYEDSDADEELPNYYAADDDKFAVMARATYHFWRGEIDRLRECHERLLAMQRVHPSYLVFSSCMLGGLDAAIDHYAEAVGAQARSFIDLGPLRAMARGWLPPNLNNQLERHPRFQALLLRHGLTEEWCASPIAELNAISHITGIRVAPDASA